VTEQAAQPPENRSFIPTPSGESLKPHQLALVGIIFGLGGLATILFFNVLQAIGFAIVVGVLAYSYLSIRNERDSLNFKPAQPLLEARGQNSFNSAPGVTPDGTGQVEGSNVPEFAKSTSNTHDFSPFPRANHAEFNAKAIAALDAAGAVLGSAAGAVGAAIGSAAGAIAAAQNNPRNNSAAPSAFGAPQTGPAYPGQTIPPEEVTSASFPAIPVDGAHPDAAPVQGYSAIPASGANVQSFSAAHPGAAPSPGFSAAHPGAAPSPGFSAAHPGAAPSPEFSAAHPGAAQSPGFSAAHPGAAPSPEFSAAHPNVHSVQGLMPPDAVGFTPADTVAASQANTFSAVPEMSVPPDQVVTVPPTQATSLNPFMRRAHYCWKCKDLMYVYSWPGHHMWSTDSPPQPRPESVQFRFYQTIGAKFWANVCQKCDAVQGDHLVFDEHSPYKWENFS